MSRQLPPMLSQQFTIEFNEKGYRKRVHAVLTIDMASVRRALAVKATRNAKHAARAGHALVQLKTHVETIGPELPQIGTVCYE